MESRRYIEADDTLSKSLETNPEKTETRILSMLTKLRLGEIELEQGIQDLLELAKSFADDTNLLFLLYSEALKVAAENKNIELSENILEDLKHTSLQLYKMFTQSPQ